MEWFHPPCCAASTSFFCCAALAHSKCKLQTLLCLKVPTTLRVIRFLSEWEILFYKLHFLGFPLPPNLKQVIRPIVAAWWLPECHHGGAGCRSWAPRAAEWRALPSRFACSAAEDVAAQPAHRPDVIPTRRVLWGGGRGGGCDMRRRRGLQAEVRRLSKDPALRQGP